MDSQLTNKCISELSGIPRDNWKYIGANILRTLNARSRDIKTEVKDVEKKIRETSLQVIIEEGSLTPSELASLQSEYEALATTRAALSEEAHRLEVRRGAYSQFSSALRPEPYILVNG